jgi:hypothetical protein
MKTLSRLLTVSLLALVPAARAQSSAAAQRFVGTWRLVSIAGAPCDASFSEDGPAGIIMYDNTGHMAVQFSRRAKRPGFAKGTNAGTVEEKAAAFNSYGAYYGTFTVDPAAGIVTHHLEGSVNPTEVGNDNVRYYEFQGNRLILTVAIDCKGARLARKDATRHLTWERIAGDRHF